MKPKYSTDLGSVYQADCIEFLKTVPSESVDLAFADPPFNLGKDYSSKINDARPDDEYLTWCHDWIDEMVRTVAPGGSLFLWNIPKWNLPLGAYLGGEMVFKNWITVDIKYSLPIQGRLYPSHYSLLYFVKGGKPRIFHPDRLPVPCCRHCGGELKDYGGYKSKMNPKGVSMTDVWTDIPPVRHAKYKKRDANALPLKLMDRIISMASDPGSLVLDPFGGSGTTFVAAELSGRRWVGSELDCSTIAERMLDLSSDRDHLSDIHANKNVLFTQASFDRRKKSGTRFSKDYRILAVEDDCSCDPVAEKQSNLFD